MKVKFNEVEMIERKKQVKNWVKLGGNKVYCILRHVSASGMSRDIDFYVLIPNNQKSIDAGQDMISKIYLSYHMAGILDYPFNDNKGLKVGGCGMDMGFHMVYSLGRVLYPNGDGKTITGRNGDTKPETDGGYLIKHEWL